MGQSNSHQNHNDEIKTNKICIGDTCLSQEVLRDILISTNNSIQLSSNTPYVKNEKNEGTCNKGYGGKIIYSSGEGLSGCNKCEAGTYKSSLSNTDCIVCPEGNYCPDKGLGIHDEKIICSAGYFCPEGSSEQQECQKGFDSAEGASLCFKKNIVSEDYLPPRPRQRQQRQRTPIGV